MVREHLDFFFCQKKWPSIDCIEVKKDRGIGMGSALKIYSNWVSLIILKAACLPDHQSGSLEMLFRSCGKLFKKGIKFAWYREAVETVNLSPR